MAHVFLSYSRTERAVAVELVQHLGLAGVDVWSDLDLELGADWPAEVSRALVGATAVVVLASPRSIASARVTYEWSTALAYSMRVIPVLTGGARFDDLPSPLSAAHGVDLDADREAALDELSSALGPLLARAAATEAATPDPDVYLSIGYAGQLWRGAVKAGAVVVRVDPVQNTVADVLKLPQLGSGQRVDDEGADGLDVAGRGRGDLVIAAVGEDGVGAAAIAGAGLAPDPALPLELRDDVRQPGQRAVGQGGPCFECRQPT